MGRFSGAVTVYVECADCAGLLNHIHNAGICVSDITYKDALSVCLTVERKDFQRMCVLADRYGGRVETLSRYGYYWELIRLFFRPVLVVGLTLLLALASWLPGKVLFFRVEGNQTVPARKILEYASECGLYFGCSRRDLRSERIKNGLLEHLEQLQWVGVNTKGCVATLSVRERSEPEQVQEENGVGSILAIRDGIITSCTVTRGNALCAPGQAVKAGDVLVSGYTDLGLTVQATRAEGEIYAQTSRDITVLSPNNTAKKGERPELIQNYSIVIGKNRINLWKDSRILQPGCDKIYTEYYLTLPGGFQLPVAIAVETCYTYDVSSVSVSENTVQAAMEQFLDAYVKGQMVSGRILTKQLTLEQNGDVYLLQGSYVCEEMIGKEYSEEIITGYGKDH